MAMGQSFYIVVHSYVLTHSASLWAGSGKEMACTKLPLLWLNTPVKWGVKRGALCASLKEGMLQV